MWLKECFDGYPWGSEVVFMGISVAQRVYVALGIRVAQSVWLDIRVDEYVFR